MSEAESTDAAVTVRQSDDLLELTLNRPHRANALGPAAVDTLLETLNGVTGVRACVLRGNGRHFCAGFDLGDLDALSDGDLLLRFVRIESLLQAVAYAPFPVIALAQGNVVGAGADLFAACWQRVATPNARFRMPGWNFEIALGTRRLTRLVGTDAARDMLIDTRGIDARQALDTGLATELATEDDWPAILARFVERARALSATAVAQLASLTTVDTRSEDMAALVASAARPGLRTRGGRARQAAREVTSAGCESSFSPARSCTTRWSFTRAAAPRLPHLA